MKKYIAVASFLILNAEVVSWIVIVVLAVMALRDFVTAIDREREAKWTQS